MTNDNESPQQHEVDDVEIEDLTDVEGAGWCVSSSGTAGCPSSASSYGCLTSH